jgi:hypothetical protein
MNMIAHQVVARDKNVVAPRGPKAVWLPEPPNAPAKSAASPLCNRITPISTRQMITCKANSTAKTFQPMNNRAAPAANEIPHFTSPGILHSRVYSF